MNRSRACRPPVPLEKHEQAAGVGLLRSLHCTVYVLGTARRAGDWQGTCQTPGICDVQAWLPDARGLLLWEVKSRVGKPSPAQVEFQTLARACEERGCGIYYCLGPFDNLIAKLITLGLLKPGQVAHYHTEGRHES